MTNTTTTTATTATTTARQPGERTPALRAATARIWADDGSPLSGGARRHARRQRRRAARRLRNAAAVAALVAGARRHDPRLPRAARLAAAGYTTEEVDRVLW